MILFHLYALSYILVPVFLDVLLFVCFLLCFLYSFDSLCHLGYLRASIYVMLLFSLYTNLSSSSFLLSSLFGSHVSAYSDSTGYVLKAPLYILIPSLCMLSICFSLLGKVVLYSWQPLSILDLHTAKKRIVFSEFSGFLHIFCLLPL